MDVLSQLNISGIRELVTMSYFDTSSR